MLTVNTLLSTIQGAYEIVIHGTESIIIFKSEVFGNSKDLLINYTEYQYRKVKSFTIENEVIYIYLSEEQQ